MFLVISSASAVVAGPCDRRPNDPRCGGTTTTTRGTTTSTTSGTTTTTTSPPGSADHDIVWIGCSNTDRAVTGYIDLGGTRMIFASAGGGDVRTWATNRLDLWEGVWDVQYNEGITQVWWNLCLKSGPGVSATTESDALAVYDEIISRAPGVPILVSAMNAYEPGFPRYDGYLATVELQGWLLDTVDVEAGPVLPLLTADLLGPDDAHPNDAGIEVLGQALIDAFGR